MYFKFCILIHVHFRGDDETIFTKHQQQAPACVLSRWKCIFIHCCQECRDLGACWRYAALTLVVLGGDDLGLEDFQT